ncbi:MAG: hypothetical protein U5L45_13780 [Saprospiraceae bacterium]|nr:hypothetical protein [Saprospiraceae bacterium]
MTYLNQGNVSAFITNNASFIANCPPSEAVSMTTQQLLYILEKKFGHHYHDVFYSDSVVASPLKIQNSEGGTWMRSSNMVGINVRTIGSFWNVVKYALTLPMSQNVVHLLPIWEPGVVASLYGVASWHINPEFFSAELHSAMPHLDSVEKQLKVVINALHQLGKIVGMDVIPHTDRFSEQVLANPRLFEWLKREDGQIVRHENDLHLAVEDVIFDYLINRYPHLMPQTATEFFSNEFGEAHRSKIMFGESWEYYRRLIQREALIQWLYEHYFETVPATMAPPYRGLKVATTEESTVIDERGRVWRDFEITKPEKFSRVFGPLTRFKLYENLDNNADWQVDFSKPRVEAYEYVAHHYAKVQQTYNFDFMRGDMAHVQMQPSGVPDVADDYYDILRYIKKYICRENNVPYFANFAETFLAPPNVMAYGDEVDHLERSQADATLGDLQSMVVGSERFMSEFERYVDILHNRSVAPAFTIMTADKDDPRFDEFYLKGNEARLFIGLFLTEMPSYMALGFEQRDPHSTPFPNEYYTKLYVFHLDKGKNSTQGTYKWGWNLGLFNRLDRIRQFSDTIYHALELQSVEWIILPNSAKKPRIIAWKVGEYVFVVNADTENGVQNINITPPQYKKALGTFKLQFSTFEKTENSYRTIESIKNQFILPTLEAGEGRIYRYNVIT